MQTYITTSLVILTQVIIVTICVPVNDDLLSNNYLFDFNQN